MRLVLISDTHSLHRQVKLPEGDVLIHAGDFMHSGVQAHELTSFCDWLKDQPFAHKLVIAGNHDFFAEQHRELVEQSLGPDVNYLEDSGIEIQGLKFWGSPVQPRFFDWAFNRDRGFAINQHWRMIPDDTDVLITHGPPNMLLDACPNGRRVGCTDLLARILQVKPKLHVFGHIHHSYGEKYFHGTRYVNASQCDEQYQITNDPIVVDL